MFSGLWRIRGLASFVYPGLTDDSISGPFKLNMFEDEHREEIDNIESITQWNCGSVSHVVFVLKARPQWDQEAVEELLRWGATPPLHSVGRMIEKPTKPCAVPSCSHRGA